VGVVSVKIRIIVMTPHNTHTTFMAVSYVRLKFIYLFLNTVYCNDDDKNNNNNHNHTVTSAIDLHRKQESEKPRQTARQPNKSSAYL